MNFAFFRPIIALLLTVVFLVSCSQTTPKGDEMLVKGTIKGLRKGTLFLQKINDTVLANVDSVTINGNPSFELKTLLKGPEVHYLYLDKEDADTLNDRILFFGEKGTITINTLLKTFESSAQVEGSENHILLQEYQSFSRKFNTKNLELVKAYLEAQRDENTTLADSLQQAMDNLLKRRYLYTLNFANTHADMAVAPYVALTEAYDANLVFLDSIAQKLTKDVKSSAHGVAFLNFLEERRSAETN
jgi:hypothetical protein